MYTYIENSKKDLFTAFCLKSGEVQFLTTFSSNTVAIYLKLRIFR